MQIESHQVSFEVQQQRLYHHERHVTAVTDGGHRLSTATQDTPPPARTSARPDDTEQPPQTEQDYRQAVKKRLIELMSGRTLNWYDNRPSENKNNQSGISHARQPAGTESRFMVRETESDYQAYQLKMRLEFENKKGNKADFSASLDWQQLNITDSLGIITAEQLKDPLVLNFDWQAVSFEGDTRFDLNRDGNKDRLPTPEGNAGYLVRDINGNGTMDNPAELLGARSGDAWADIASMDSNADGWLNSNDDAFKQLYWWQPGAGRQLSSLTSLKVDGLLLQGADTRADIAPKGEKQARLRQTGAFVYNTNQLGLMQQFDFYI